MSVKPHGVSGYFRSCPLPCAKIAVSLGPRTAVTAVKRH